LQLAQSVASTSSETDTKNNCRVILISDTVERPSAPGVISLRSSLALSVDRIGASTTIPLNRGIARISARRDRQSPTTVRLFVQLTSNRAANAASAASEAMGLHVTALGRTLSRGVSSGALAASDGVSSVGQVRSPLMALNWP
jgi:hypothetical protein